MTEEVWKVTITGVFTLAVAVIGVVFGRKPKREDERVTGNEPVNGDQTLIKLVERLVDQRVADLTAERDALKIENKALREENTMLKDKIAGLEERIEALEAERKHE